MKRPAFQFYPGDWLTDTALRCCSIGARGLWIDMICFMHGGSTYGYLKVNHKVIHTSNLARMVGLTADEAEGYIQELIDAGVCQVDEEGLLFLKADDSRRKPAPGKGCRRKEGRKPNLDG